MSAIGRAKAMPSTARTIGMEVKTILIDPGSLDATSVILEAMAFKPDAIDFLLPKEVAIPLYAAAEQQQLGGKVVIAVPTSQYDESVPKAIGPYWNKARPRLRRPRARAAG